MELYVFQDIWHSAYKKAIKQNQLRLLLVIFLIEIAIGRQLILDSTRLLEAENRGSIKAGALTAAREL